MEPRKYKLNQRVEGGEIYLIESECYRQPRSCGDWCPHFQYTNKVSVSYDGGKKIEVDVEKPFITITCSGIEKIIEVQEAE